MSQLVIDSAVPAMLLAGLLLLLHRLARSRTARLLFLAGVMLLDGLLVLDALLLLTMRRPDPLALAIAAACLAAATASLLVVSRNHRPRATADARVVRSVLAIGAHPDDIEFGCGAALARYRDDGYAIHGLVLSQGENGFPNGRFGNGARKGEALDGAQRLGLNSLSVLNFPDTKLTSRRDEIRDAIEATVRRHEPCVVFTHTGIDLHSDHRMVFHATVEACRSVPTILCYENPNTPPHFKPQFFIDVTESLDDKIAALRCHASQRSKAYFKPELIRSMARMRGNQAKVQFAEAFEVIRARMGAL